MSDTKYVGVLGLLLAVASVVTLTSTLSAPLSSIITYQGTFTDQGLLTNGDYDFEIELWTDATVGSQIGATLVLDNITTVAGVFTLPLDFGTDAYSGNDLWLMIRVRDGASLGSYTDLLPRQVLTAAPSALHTEAVSANSITQAQTDPDAVQGRVVGQCGAQQYIRSIDNQGNAVCGLDLDTDTDTTYSAGAGLALTAGQFDIDRSEAQLRVSQPCAAGSYLGQINDDGTIECTADVNTSYSAGLGLGLQGSLLGVDSAVVQTRVNGTCALGSYLRGINLDGSVICTAVTGTTQVTTLDNTAFVGGHTSIAIGSDGFPVISYRDFSNSSLKVAKCANSACTGGASLTTVDNTANVGFNSSIAIGSDGFPVISHYDISNTSLKVAKCANSACTSGANLTTVDNTANVGLSSSIAIGSDGFPVISYRDFSNTSLKVTKCANSACTGSVTLTTVDNTAEVGADAAIAIGLDGLPVISYRDTTSVNLKVAKCANSACTGSATLTTVDDTDVVVQWSGIAIGSDGLPVISYYDNADPSLRVAKCVNSACTGTATLTLVDKTANVGQSTSIAIGSDGLPVISYWDSTNANLKVAKCSTPSCR